MLNRPKECSVSTLSSINSRVDINGALIVRSGQVLRTCTGARRLRPPRRLHCHVSMPPTVGFLGYASHAACTKSTRFNGGEGGSSNALRCVDSENAAKGTSWSPTSSVPPPVVLTRPCDWKRVWFRTREWGRRSGTLHFKNSASRKSPVISCRAISSIPIGRPSSFEILLKCSRLSLTNNNCVYFTHDNHLSTHPSTSHKKSVTCTHLHVS